MASNWEESGRTCPFRPGPAPFPASCLDACLCDSRRRGMRVQDRSMGASSDVLDGWGLVKDELWSVEIDDGFTRGKPGWRRYAMLKTLQNRI